jgi:isoleucyl-tRNA synthetase
MDKGPSNIQLPKTDFPMKGNLSQTEPARIESWRKNRIYEKMLARPARKGKFVMPDGPPYANGAIHVGHVLNKVLKDITIKYRNLSGYQAAFIPGWDCHGLPIELNVTKKLGAKRAETSDVEIRELCRKEALGWVDKQQKQFERLGVLADWGNPYLTLKPAYEADEVRVLAKINDNGLFYRGEKPVFWCPALQTALAAAEVEYRPHKSPSIFVKFPLGEDKAKLGFAKDSVSFVVWTTTPWTLPANYAVALNAEFKYGLFRSENEILIVAENLKESVEAETGLKLELVTTKLGKELEGLKARHPFLDRDSLVILGDHVLMDATGVVHTAPGHGIDDYVVGLKYGLPIESPVNEAGKFTAAVPEFQGISIWNANPLIVEKLRGLGLLLAFKEIEHSYPHNPRSKTPLIFRATPQWFIRLEDPEFNLRAKCLAAAEKQIKYYPGWGQQRLVGMLSNSPDWCLSRQRIWGVPVPVFYCTKCNEPLVSSAVMNRLADVMEESGRGLEVYHTETPKIFTGDAKCKCGSTEFKAGRDILDVWFDSGICHTAVQKRRPQLAFPADIYLEGSDQHRGWFQTSLVSSMAAYGEAPFKALLTHGFVNDAQGYKMSKSLGNTVDPEEIIKESGAEILRLWVSHEDYGQDLKISKEMMTRITDAYRRFRNTFRFMLGNLYDFSPANDTVAYKDLMPLDHWALSELGDLITKCEAAYESYEYYKVFHAVNHFFTVDLSATYLDVLKDRLYTSKADGSKRRAAQTVIFKITQSLCSLLAPIATFLAEEVHSYLPEKVTESILLSDFPKIEPDWQNLTIAADFNRLIAMREVVSKVLEEKRQAKEIGASLEAALKITSRGGDFKLLEKYQATLKELFIVSAVTLIEGTDFKVESFKADGEKCPRCWHYDPLTGKNAKVPDVCPKCVEALS